MKEKDSKLLVFDIDNPPQENVPTRQKFHAGGTPVSDACNCCFIGMEQLYQFLAQNQPYSGTEKWLRKRRFSSLSEELLCYLLVLLDIKTKKMPRR